MGIFGRTLPKKAGFIVYFVQSGEVGSSLCSMLSERGEEQALSIANKILGKHGGPADKYVVVVTANPWTSENAYITERSVAPRQLWTARCLRDEFCPESSIVYTSMTSVTFSPRDNWGRGNLAAYVPGFVYFVIGLHEKLGASVVVVSAAKSVIECVFPGRRVAEDTAHRLDLSVTQSRAGTSFGVEFHPEVIVG
jgi:hypothetical protein